MVAWRALNTLATASNWSNGAEGPFRRGFEACVSSSALTRSCAQRHTPIVAHARASERTHLDVGRNQCLGSDGLGTQVKERAQLGHEELYAHTHDLVSHGPSRRSPVAPDAQSAPRCLDAFLPRSRWGLYPCRWQRP